MDTESIAPIGFTLVFVGVIVWFVMVSSLFRRLLARPPGKVSHHGRTRAISEQYAAHELDVYTFSIQTRRPGASDPSLSRLSRTMLVFLVCYCIVFFGLVAAMMNSAPVHHGP